MLLQRAALSRISEIRYATDIFRIPCIICVSDKVLW
ncbi:hypothetical protein CHELA1G11_13172 [Hyphomicrobiales bacterium]|nr:hypothetical protein CHELA1G2_11138 [Hyphomicrobiales bacterium]CAH1669809.1 hypothetical protein CHELA1G11_13172 [Hyphomicrobiales bacterium]